MKIKLIKQLAKASFDNNSLNENKIKIVSSKLKRKDLRSYLRALKILDQENTLFVSMPITDDEKVKNALQIRFPNKKIVYTLNKDLLAGIKIVNNDLLYDFTLQGKIERLIGHFYDTND